MKLVVMIPAYNEEKYLPLVIKEIPKKIPGIDKIEVLVIDDGSTDNTVASARKAGANHVIFNRKNSGLAFTFQKGMDYALSLGADIIVNTDADFQYNQKQITNIVKPILEGKADIVSGNRQVEKLEHMTFAKKYGNMMGSKVVELAAGYKIKDASSGFRSYSKEAALRLFVTSTHTYTHDTLIQASHKNLKVIEVPVDFRKREGHSKLIKSVFSHVRKSMETIVRNTLMYNSMRTFGTIGLITSILGLIPIIRWLILTYILQTDGAYIQSMMIGVMLVVFGGLIISIGFVSDLLAINRKYLEQVLYKQKKSLLRK
jgi:glycosyltransferase involved in cell wall biosynthesis